METSGVTVAADLSAKIVVLCSQYIAGIANARAEIERLREQLKNLETTLRHANHLLEQPNGQFLSASRELDDPLQRCQAELQRLQDKLEPSTTRKAMRRFGLRAAKWPFSKSEVEVIIASLVDYREAITAVLQVDQTMILLDISQKVDLSLQMAASTSMIYKSHFIVPFPRDPDFVDRPALREWLEYQYNTSPARRIALVGMGGFGKSQIAIEFAHRVHIKSPETSVFWVHGGTVVRFEESYRSLANALTLPDRHEPNVNVLALVRDWLQMEEAPSWLMILDNADEMEIFFPSRSQNDGNDREPLASYLPKTGNGKIVFTSRNRRVAEKLTGSHKAIQEVPTMDSREALKILENKLSRDVDQDAAIDLARALDFIPLAVNQAAAYINRRAPRVSIRSYLDGFQQNEKQKKIFLNRDAGDLRRREDVSNSVVITWQVTFEQIRHERPTAANLLLLMSFFQSQNIPEFMLSGYNIATSDWGNGNEHNDEDLEDDLDVLQGYSLIRLSTTAGLFDMHALVQFCTRVWLSESYLKFSRVKSLFLSLSVEHFPSGEFETWAKCQLLLPHMKPFLDEELTDKLILNDWSELLAKVSWYLQMTEDHFGAESTARKALRSCRELLGDEDCKTLEMMRLLSSVYFLQGRLTDAELLKVQVMETSKKILGDEHPETLSSMSGLATTYRMRGNFEEAEKLGLQVMETSKRIFGDEHPKTLSSMSDLASIYASHGRSAEAEVLVTQEIKIRKGILGDEHPGVLDTIVDLALILQEQGKLAEAESLYLHVVETRKRILGDEHVDVLVAMVNLGFIYQQQGRLSEAETLSLQVIEIRERVLGHDHPSVLDAMVYLILIFREQRRFMEAEALGKELVEVRKRVLGDEHPDVLDAMINLAFIYQEQGCSGDALVLLRDTVSHMQRILGPDDRATLFGLETLGEWEHDQT